MYKLVGSIGELTFGKTEVPQTTTSLQFANATPIKLQWENFEVEAIT